MRTITYREAVREALIEEMNRDESVFLMGEEVAEYNGAYKISEGMLDQFGPKRVIDTPISENGFAGLGVGAAMAGLRPVVEFMTFSFSLVAFDQLVNNAPNMVTMSGGQFHIPMVFRGPNGPVHALGATHSHATENFYANVPGLKVCTPGTIRDAKGLLKTAIRDDNPVVVLESEKLYNSSGEIEDIETELLIPLGHANVLREGSDCTLITYAQTVPTVLALAEKIKTELNVDCEVIDLRSIRPLDTDTIFQSIAKTNRAVIIEQNRPVCGIGAQITYEIQHEIFDELDAPVARVAQIDIPMPYNESWEDHVFPNETRITDAIKEVCYL
ncbi:MAG: pyruvate dehydrogenase complex E1 component subunit beta [Verrucomicrobiota bacterium]